MKTVFVTHGDPGAALREAGIATFDDLWSWPGEAVDAPNRRGDGFSTVSRHRLVTPGDQGRFYLKRQRDYFPRHRLVGRELLLWREYRALRRFRALGIDCPTVAAVALRSVPGGRQGVLVTTALDQHEPLDALIARHGGRPPDAVSRAVADFLRRMHGRRLFHGNLYPKHLYVHAAVARGGTVDDPVSVIDLEDARRVPWARYAVVRDLEKLNRYAEGVSAFRRLRFLLRYLGVRRLNRRQRRLLDAIVARGRRRAVPDRAGRDAGDVPVRRSHTP